MPPKAAPAASATQRAVRLVALDTHAPPFDVFESKLAIPDVRSGIVSRTALVNLLRAERSHRLATMVAPAGYGKTTLLAQWAARDERPFAWLTVDERDNDPLVFLRHLAAAFDRIEPVGRRVLDSLVEPARRSVWTAAAPRLGAAVSGFRPFVAVLDDVHLLRRGDSAALLAMLADHVPAGAMLVLSGRAQPPLALARLRVSGELLEVDWGKLALGRREAQLLLRSTGVELADEDEARLLEKTEGWAAGLYLATLALTGTEPDIDAFDGRDRSVAEYFESEHLSRLSPDRLRFLQRTSVLEWLSGPLCDAILEERDSVSVLESIRRSNLFLVPLDRSGGRYRYHELFRDVLRKELEEREPELVRTLNERAADWFEAHGEPEPALEHAEASGDHDRAARLLGAIALPVQDAGRLDKLERWLERFATEAPLDAYPAVAALAGWIHALRGRTADAQRALELAQRGRPARDVRARVALLRATMCAEGVERMEEDADTALADLAAGSPWRPVALLVRAAVSMLNGADEEADSRLAEAAVAAEGAGATVTLLVALAERSLLASAAGDHQAAERLALEARDLVADGAVADYATSAIVHAAAARALLRHGRWDDARRELTMAERLAANLTDALPWLAVQTRLALAHAYVTLRDRVGVSSQVAEVEALLASRPALGVLGAEVTALRDAIGELPGARDGHSSGLTGAELRLLPYLATHLSFREIGDRLFVSRNTIKTQAISAYRKLGVSSRSAAIARATELGLVDDGAGATADFIRTG